MSKIIHEFGEVVLTSGNEAKISQAIGEVVLEQNNPYAKLSQVIGEVVLDQPSYAKISNIIIEVAFIPTSFEYSIWPNQRLEYNNNIQGSRIKRRFGQI
jgi:hypothetical protein